MSYPSLEQYKLKLQNVRGDGNCFYHAMARQMEITCYVDSNTLRPITHEKLRSIAIEHIKKNRLLYPDDKLLAASEGRYSNFDEYIKAHSKNGEWADEIIKTALAKELNINIAIFSPKYSTPWTHKQENALLTAYIHHDGGHYQSVIPENSSINLPEIGTLSDDPYQSNEYTISDNWLLDVSDLSEVIKRNEKYIEKMNYDLKIEHLILTIKYLNQSYDNKNEALKNTLENLFAELSSITDKQQFIANVIESLKQIADEAKVNIEQFNDIWEAMGLDSPSINAVETSLTDINQDSSTQLIHCGSSTMTSNSVEYY